MSSADRVVGFAGEIETAGAGGDPTTLFEVDAAGVGRAGVRDGALGSDCRGGRGAEKLKVKLDCEAIAALTAGSSLGSSTRRRLKIDSLAVLLSGAAAEWLRVRVDCSRLRRAMLCAE
jgi:hypothetical protein